MPDSDEYAQLLKGNFADWRLQVDGLVQRPLTLSLEDLMGLPSRTQITCRNRVEGWNSIAKWQSVQPGRVLAVRWGPPCGKRTHSMERFCRRKTAVLSGIRRQVIEFFIGISSS